MKEAVRFAPGCLFLLPWTPAALQNWTFRDDSRLLAKAELGRAAMAKWTRSGAAALVTLSLTSAAPPNGPTEVVGIALPRTSLALKAEAFVRRAEPDFLFNHSVRTYVWGALRLRARGMPFDPETAYVAALFHDLGLMPAMASPNSSFEIDGATKAEEFVRANGGTAEQGRTVWNAIAFHDMGRSYEIHQSSEALLLGAGTGSDVDGIDPKAILPSTVAEVLEAYPRLQFKKRFTAAAVDHCKRKPTSQIGWLETLCLKVAPNIDRGDVEEEIASAPFVE